MMTDVARQNATPHQTGTILHWAFGYDLLVGLLSLGRERTYRENTVKLAKLKTGESVLDIGCGTGTLAIAAKRQVGPTGRVYGIDASPEMIDRARKKAKKGQLDITFENVFVQELPFPDSTFDAVLSVTMLHHLSREARRQCLREVRRVLKPGGRLLAIDFGGPVGNRHSWISRFHRHGKIDLNQMVPVLNEVGLHSVESGTLERNFGPLSDLHFILAVASEQTT